MPTPTPTTFETSASASKSGYAPPPAASTYDVYDTTGRKGGMGMWFL
ncbi:hypothetical protein A1F94_009282 [Pyrenophora tritici-repentis]|nr:hypothetical protein PtrV1_12410 [Pyrenophora tritici-repentis]KAF7445214.1 hypothetical protein A1F99_102000 [Pyrenophora tritici-repentis]KAF7565480.1 hypothetical protein PtrM4_049140 [Pyrenophora tritici-repentis]KAG9380387.1 hypothetical protein A1F94_009282 [Pyrenophora tritici-repentis]KAI0584694.1 hypothetical protein Alg215_02931 [Pyrenophora tritici-repentis]